MNQIKEEEFQTAELIDPPHSLIESGKSNRVACRICLGDEEDSIKNPLISPCKCLGSLKYIHIDCLKKWLLLLGFLLDLL